jgi:pyridoxamine 5'-phosphate oxidase
MLSLSPWRSPLARNIHLHRGQPESRYVQLATVTPDNLPANRTVVFRGFADEYNRLKFVTDIRSQKVSEIRHNPQAEACWYFPKTREQFRLAGTLLLIDLDAADPNLQIVRAIVWRELSDAARIQFAWATPGELTDLDADLNEAIAPPDPLTPLENFCLLLLEPIRVDRLELRGNPQNRTLYTFQDGAWHKVAINP